MSRIQNHNRVWRDICHVNRLACEYSYLGKDNDIPILTAKNFFANPDQVTKFFEQGHWWENGHNDMSDNLIRPGRSLYFHEEIMEWFAQPIISGFKSLLGVQNIKVHSINGNCFNGDMPLNNVLAAFPHTDIVGEFQSSPQIAFNISLTRPTENTITNGDRVQTGFWSYEGKKSKLDFSFNDESKLEDFNQYLQGTSNDSTKGFQIDDYDPYKLEQIVTMDYNSLVAYPSHFLHNPYMKSHWFTDHDRLTIAGFLSVSPEELNFEERFLEDVSYAWEFFQLDKIHNFHPKKTKIID